MLGSRQDAFPSAMAQSRHVPFDNSPNTFIQAYGTRGYVPCGMNSAPEERFERIALFAKHKLGKLEATHAARLLPNGCWTSKLGPCEDIEHHMLLDVECPEYGFVFCILKRYAPPRVKYVISLKSTMNRDVCLIRLSCAAAVHTQSAFICGSIILCSLFSAHASSSTRTRRETPM